jgi:hypothetical protein
MNRHRQARDATPFAVDGMTALDPQQLLTVALQHPSELVAGDRLHTAISRTRSLPVCVDGSRSTERQPSIAS